LIHDQACITGIARGELFDCNCHCTRWHETGGQRKRDRRVKLAWAQAIIVKKKREFALTESLASEKAQYKEVVETGHYNEGERESESEGAHSGALMRIDLIKKERWVQNDIKLDFVGFRYFVFGRAPRHEIDVSISSPCSCTAEMGCCLLDLRVTQVSEPHPKNKVVPKNRFTACSG
jgi:hypothetical protein